MESRAPRVKRRAAGRARPRGSYKKSESSRRQVLDAAVRALARHGYAKTSVADIAVAAGMSKGAVHYHFESKDDLIANVLERCAEAMARRARAAWAAPGEPRDKLRRALREMWTMRREGGEDLRVLADLMAQSLHDARLRAPIHAMFQLTRTELAARLEEALAVSGLRSRVPTSAIPRLLLSVLDGLVLHYFFDPPVDGEEDEVLNALETIAVDLFCTG